MSTEVSRSTAVLLLRPDRTIAELFRQLYEENLNKAIPGKGILQYIQSIQILKTHPQAYTVDALSGFTRIPVQFECVFTVYKPGDIVENAEKIKDTPLGTVYQHKGARILCLEDSDEEESSDSWADQMESTTKKMGKMQIVSAEQIALKKSRKPSTGFRIIASHVRENGSDTLESESSNKKAQNSRKRTARFFDSEDSPPHQSSD